VERGEEHGGAGHASGKGGGEPVAVSLIRREDKGGGTRGSKIMGGLRREWAGREGRGQLTRCEERGGGVRSAPEGAPLHRITSSAMVPEASTEGLYGNRVSGSRFRNPRTGPQGRQAQNSHRDKRRLGEGVGGADWRACRFLPPMQGYTRGIQMRSSISNVLKFLLRIGQKEKENDGVLYRPARPYKIQLESKNEQPWGRACCLVLLRNLPAPPPFFWSRRYVRSFHSPAEAQPNFFHR